MIKNDWNDILKDEFNKEYFKNMMIFLQNEYKTKEIFPPYDEIFTALNLTSFEDTTVVIIGQDPYINFGQAQGLAFSVPEDQKIPPSLVNIYKEISTEFGEFSKTNGNLKNWAKQGVLLLNATLTVQSGISNSHEKIGWQQFTDTIITKLSEKDAPIVFVLWGNFAIKKQKLIKNNPKHLILTASHPSPLSARHSFFGCNHFIKINQFLCDNNLKPINFTV